MTVTRVRRLRPYRPGRTLPAPPPPIGHLERSVLRLAAAHPRMSRDTVRRIVGAADSAAVGGGCPIRALLRAGLLDETADGYLVPTPRGRAWLAALIR